MSDTANSAAPHAREDVLFRRVGEDWLLFDPHTQDVHVLNLTAALVWAHCDGKHRPAEIKTALTDAYPDIDSEAAVKEALDHFRELGLLAE